MVNAVVVTNVSIHIDIMMGRLTINEQYQFWLASEE